MPPTWRRDITMTPMTCATADGVALHRMIYRVARKSKPLPNYQKIVLNRIKARQ